MICDRSSGYLRRKILPRGLENLEKCVDGKVYVVPVLFQVVTNDIIWIDIEFGAFRPFHDGLDQSVDDVSEIRIAMGPGKSRQKSSTSRVASEQRRLILCRLAISVQAIW